ncbi:MAG: His-Xaa-Ser system radical SAM maturase HxsC [Opitutae bacterium]|nr:His-Xaa-Ser system radical SAM maturase HxsC [Opitutae bacterium]
MKLSGPASFPFVGEPRLLRLERACDSGFEAIDLAHPTETCPVGFTAAPHAVVLSSDFDYLQVGDILRANPAAREVRTLYRRHSRHNVLFFTERCNSRCLMCSQPPRAVQDDHLVAEILQMIPWLDRSTLELGITGGEPTLLGDRLLDVLRALRTHLPDTAVHMLSNGRQFRFAPFAQQVAAAQPKDFMIGVPLYADTAAQHDYVVQARGAFEETIFGLLNLARVGVRIELRCVLHRATYQRLPQFARFVARNLPFVDQVSFMGLELMGFARSNLDALWIDPADYQAELEQAVEALDTAAIPVQLFNLPLCVLRPNLVRFARRAISDWKNIYLPACTECAARDRCGGFFASSTLRHSAHLRPFSAPIATFAASQ